MESPEAQLGDTAGTQLTLALAYSVYTLKENKRLGWGEFKRGEGGSRSNKTGFCGVERQRSTNQYGALLDIHRQHISERSVALS